MVAKLWSQRGHFESTLIPHLFRLSGVGRVSEPAFRVSEPAFRYIIYVSVEMRAAFRYIIYVSVEIRAAWIRFHTLFLASSSVISRN